MLQASNICFLAFHRVRLPPISQLREGSPQAVPRKRELVCLWVLVLTLASQRPGVPTSKGVSLRLHVDFQVQPAQALAPPL